VSPLRRGAGEGDVLFVLCLSCLAGARSVGFLAGLAVEPASAFGVSRYFCSRLLGFSGTVYSISPAAMRSATACRMELEMDLWPMAAAISDREAGAAASATMMRW